MKKPVTFSVLFMVFIFVDPSVGDTIEIQSSNVDNDLNDIMRMGRFLVYTSTSTTSSPIATATVLLSSYTTCYRALAVLTACKSTSVNSIVSTGRKKRGVMIEKEPNKYLPNLRDAIVATRVGSDELPPKLTAAHEQLSKELGDRTARLLTVIKTETVGTTFSFTVTTTPLEREEMVFTSTDANACLPADLIATIPACI